MASETTVSSAPVGLEPHAGENSARAPVSPVQPLRGAHGLQSKWHTWRHRCYPWLWGFQAFAAHLKWVWAFSFYVTEQWRKNWTGGRNNFSQVAWVEKYYSLPTLTEAALFQLLGQRKLESVSWIWNSVLFVQVQLTLEGEKTENTLLVTHLSRGGKTWYVILSFINRHICLVFTCSWDRASEILRIS